MTAIKHYAVFNWPAKLLLERRVRTGQFLYW